MPNHDDRHAAFLDRVQRGEKIEATDWMPDEYRIAMVKFLQMHALSELMGALPEKEWVPRAPTLARKLSLMAKVQDEVGHAQLILRVAEDLAAPLGKGREELVAELFTGETKFHNVFHMPAPTWADAGIIGWLVDGAAVVSQAALLTSSYAPYARVLQRVCAEEGFHIQHGESICLALAEGTPAQRQMLQDALNRWWEALLLFFGPPESNSPRPPCSSSTGSGPRPTRSSGRSSSPSTCPASGPWGSPFPTPSCGSTRKPAGGSTPRPTGQS